MSLLLSLIPLSYIIASKRELVNINSLVYISTMFHLIDLNSVSENINIDIIRDRSHHSSADNYRESSAHSDVFSISYKVRMGAQNHNLS